jgi:tetratricopeptide (TPR) repeat protein
MGNSALSYNDSGVEKHNNGDHDGAIEDYTKAIECDGKYVMAYANRALSKRFKGEYDGAIQDHDKTIELNGNEAMYYSQRGRTKRYKNEYDGAIEDYSKAIELDGSYVLAYANRGVCKHSKNDYDGAIEDYNRAIELGSNNAMDYSNRGISIHAKGDYDDAIKDFTKAIELDGEYTTAYSYRGLSKYTKCDYDGAIEDFTKAIELNRSRNLAAHLLYSRRGIAKHAKCDYDGSIEDFTKAIELDSTNSQYHIDRAAAYRSQGHVPLAEADTYRAAQLTAAIQADSQLPESDSVHKDNLKSTSTFHDSIVRVPQGDVTLCSIARSLSSFNATELVSSLPDRKDDVTPLYVASAVGNRQDVHQAILLLWKQLDNVKAFMQALNHRVGAHDSPCSCVDAAIFHHKFDIASMLLSFGAEPLLLGVQCLRQLHVPAHLVQSVQYSTLACSRVTTQTQLSYYLAETFEQKQMYVNDLASYVAASDECTHIRLCSCPNDDPSTFTPFCEQFFSLLAQRIPASSHRPETLDFSGIAMSDATDVLSHASCLKSRIKTISLTFNNLEEQPLMLHQFDSLTCLFISAGNDNLPITFIDCCRRRAGESSRQAVARLFRYLAHALDGNTDDKDHHES